MSLISINEHSPQELCIRHCMDCFEQLTRAVRYSLEKGGEFLEGEHLKLLFEGIDLCRVSSTLLLTNSDLAREHGQITARICEECSRSCKSYNDSFLDEVAIICDQTATVCRQMAH